MRTPVHVLARALSLLLLGTMGCESTEEEATGSLRVRTFTSGLDLDPNGYRVKAGPESLPIDVSGTVTFEAAVGELEVRLDDVAPNCVAASGAAVTVEVVEGSTAEAAFAVECGAEWGVIEVAVPTTGIDLDGDGYLIQLDQSAPRRIFPEGTTYFFFVNRGSHQLRLTDVADNCSVPNNGSVGLAVTAGRLARDTVRTAFAVSCGATSGILEVSLATTGAPSSGFSAVLDGSSAFSVTSGDIPTRVVVDGGSHTVSLGSLPNNCLPEGGTSRTFSVALGGSVRDTARAAFSVNCFGTHGLLRVQAATSGTNLDADGYLIGVDCYYDYYYSGEWVCAATLRVAPNGTLDIPLLVGQHAIDISHVANNCTLQGVASRSFVIASDAITDVRLAVTCAASLAQPASRVLPHGADRQPLGAAAKGLPGAP
jgi:hypothetical protein